MKAVNIEVPTDAYDLMMLKKRLVGEKVVVNSRYDFDKPFNGLTGEIVIMGDENGENLNPIGQLVFVKLDYEQKPDRDDSTILFEISNLGLIES
jgi:hypothetical protein